MYYCATCCAEDSQNDSLISRAVPERSENVLADIEQQMAEQVPVFSEPVKMALAPRDEIPAPAKTEAVQEAKEAPAVAAQGLEDQEAAGGAKMLSPDDWVALQARFAHLPTLPENWIRIKSGSTGRLYFFNTISRESTFSGPWDVPPDWVEKVSKSTGKTYYYNQKINKSQFGKPAHFDEWACEHDLDGFVTDEDGWTCSACSRVMACGSKMFGCRACDFDLCPACKMCWLPGRLCTHTATKFVTDVDGWVCSYCKAEISQNSHMYGCRLCDFDLCSACNAAKAALACSHELRLFCTDIDGWTCSACTSSLAQGVDMYGCRVCDVDLCQSCYGQSQKVNKA